MVQMPLEPAETRPRSNFPKSRVAFQGTISSAKHRRNVLMARTEYFDENEMQPRGNYTQSHTFAALIRLSTTMHDLLTFNTSEISSNNSEKLSLVLADKHLWAFLLQHEMLQNVNSCGEALTPSVKVTMLTMLR